MVISVIKEVFILLLLSIAILLILAILFYDYIPMNKYIPVAEEYSTPNNILEELNDYITESEKIEVTYEVTDADLSLYKQSGSYTEGKSNPFALGETTGDSSSGDSSSGDSSSGDSSSGSSSSGSSSSGSSSSGSSSSGSSSSGSSSSGDSSSESSSTGTFFDDEVK